MTQLSDETVGKFFVDKSGQVWRHIMFCDSPTATVERVEMTGRAGAAPARVGGAVGSPILQDLGLRLLVPEEPT